MNQSVRHHYKQIYTDDVYACARNVYFHMPQVSDFNPTISCAGRSISPRFIFNNCSISVANLSYNKIYCCDFPHLKLDIAHYKESILYSRFIDYIIKEKWRPSSSQERVALPIQSIASKETV